ncbi:hypothetical protein [Teredinibacter haidensis]|uniref:hypothetical protein n=1 Tax=Teredinibacter haidensis TaxID=2731755 RepID=UPI0009491F49|nr:hypothetical protein [Teredinibacter haidensis]
MSVGFLPPAYPPDLLKVLVHQSQPLREFAEADRVAAEKLSRLDGALAPALYQSGGLLDEQTLDIFFASPLPDAPLAATLKTQANAAGLNPSVETPKSTRQKKIHAAKISDRETVQTNEKHPYQKADVKKTPVSKQVEAEPVASTEAQSAGDKPQNEDIAHRLYQKVTVLQQANRSTDATPKPRPNQTFGKTICDKKTSAKNSTKAQIKRKRDTADIESNQSKKTRDIKILKSEKYFIDRRKAEKLLADKWGQMAWNSVIKTDGRSASSEQIFDSENKNRSNPTITEQSTAETKLEKKLAQILDKKNSSGEQINSSELLLTANPSKTKKLTSSGHDAHQKKALPVANAEPSNAHDYKPGEIVSVKAEGLVGLRGLAARAEESEAVAPASGLARNGSAHRSQPAQASHAIGGLPTTPEQGGGGKALQIAELAETLAEEARRAGINLEQFQP